MRALLILYFIYALKIERAEAANLYGSFTSLVYLSGLIGGYVADKFIGQKQAIIWGALMITAGQFLLGFENIGIIYSALGLLIMGNGFFKISISTLVGSLYQKNDPRRDGGFTYFYMAVNLGAFLAGIIGGVAKAVADVIHKLDPEREVKVVSAQGLKDCRKLLTLAKAGKYDGYLLEGMACPGGCVAGAGTLQAVEKSTALVNKYVKDAPLQNSLDSKYEINLDLITESHDDK
jgi:hypothetical protein